MSFLFIRATAKGGGEREMSARYEHAALLDESMEQYRIDSGVGNSCGLKLVYLQRPAAPALLRICSRAPDVTNGTVGFGRSSGLGTTE